MSTLTTDSKSAGLSKNEVKDNRLKEQELFKSIAKSLGPSIFLKEASNLIFTELELKRIKENFLVRKLKLNNSNDLDKKFEKATQEFIISPFEKKRVFFYYYLVKFFKKEEIYKNDKQKETNKNTALNKIVDSFGNVNSQIEKSNDEILVDFGQNFIEKQKNLDQDIFEILDKNFSSLY